MNPLHLYSFKNILKICSFTIKALLVAVPVVVSALMLAGCGEEKKLLLGESSKTYFREIESGKEESFGVSSVTLYDNRTAFLEFSEVSGYTLPRCTYSVGRNTLRFYANIEENDDLWLSAYGLVDGDFVAQFFFSDESTLTFLDTSLDYAEFAASYTAEK